ncbi:MAG: hypothetical protein N2B06_09925, partial [Clostridium sp.]
MKNFRFNTKYVGIKNIGIKAPTLLFRNCSHVATKSNIKNNIVIAFSMLYDFLIINHLKKLVVTTNGNITHRPPINQIVS